MKILVIAGTISLREIIQYVEERTGTKAVLDENGDDTPYNDLYF